MPVSAQLYGPVDSTPGIEYEVLWTPKQVCRESNPGLSSLWCSHYTDCAVSFPDTYCCQGGDVSEEEMETCMLSVRGSGFDGNYI